MKKNVNEKHPKLTRILPVQRRPLFDTVLLAVISAAVFFLLPLAQYTYSKTTYGLAGLRFLTGTYVMGGSVYIAPVPMLFVFLILFLSTLLLGLLFGRMKPSAGGVALLVVGLLQMAMAVLANTQIENIMPGVKKVSSGLGLTLLMFLGVVIMIRGFYTLYQLGSINALDFMVLPAGIYLLINNYFPMVGMFIAFKNIDYRVGILSSPWCGFDNFKYLFNTTDAWVITRNTLLYNAVFIVTSNILGVIIGLFLHRVLHKRMQKLFQTTILLPQLISYVIVGYIVFAFLSNEAGLVTTAIANAEGSAPNFYSERGIWPFLLTFVYNWKQIGYNSVIYLAAIAGVSENLYEASSIDGAGRLQQIFKITLPMIKSTVITLVLLQIGRIFYSDFGLFYQVPMNSGMLFPVTNTIDTYVYRMLMVNNRIGMASAASVYQSIVGFILVLIANLVVRKVSREDALF